MSREEESRWRDGLFCELGRIKQGMKDLSHSFDDFKRTFNGNGQPGRCAIEEAARHGLEIRLAALEDLRARAAWIGTLWKIAEIALATAGATILLAALHHCFGWP